MYNGEWHNYIRKLEMLFSEDEDVEVGNYSVVGNVVHIDILCHDIERFQALRMVLKSNIFIDGKRILLDFVYDGTTTDDYDETFRKAFSGNPYFKEIVRNDEHKEFDYAVFKKEVISYFSDNVGDYNGNSNELVADIVKDVNNLVDCDGALRILPCSET